MNKIIEQLEKIKIVPVIVLESPEKAVPLAQALIKGGIPCAEITLRTQSALEAIKLISQAVPGILLGAGTVLSCKQASAAVGAGAGFIVTPGFNPKVVRHCVKNGMPIIPGCLTPSEMEQAIEHGLGAIKFFPAQQSGGLAYLKAVAAPYPMLKFMPTGGIGPANLKQYLSFGKIMACGGSWMVPKELVENNRFNEITALCKAAVKLTK